MAAATLGSPGDADARQDPVARMQDDALARLEIPKIGQDVFVVPGVDIDDLKDGPGHYPDTPLPGQLGNAAIAGHRTTYGAPFAHLERLVAGDVIVVETATGADAATGGCDCTANINHPGAAATGTYTVAGNVITTSSGAEYSYCVEGNTLTLTPTAGEEIAYFRLRPRGDSTEGYYGLGNAHDQVNHRGKLRAMQLEADMQSESGYNEIHVPVPFVIGTTGWGVFVENPYPAAFNLGLQSRRYGVEVGQPVVLTASTIDHDFTVSFCELCAVGTVRIEIENPFRNSDDADFSDIVITENLLDAIPATPPRPGARRAPRKGSKSRISTRSIASSLRACAVRS